MHFPSKRAIKKSLSGLALSFSAAAYAQTTAVPPSPAISAPATAASFVSDTESTLWKTEYMDTVLSLHKCPQTGICGSLYWLNPKDEKIFDYFGDPKIKASRRTDDIFSGPTEEDTKALCGFTPRMKFQQVAADRWSGTLETRGYNMTVNVEVKIDTPDRISVVTSKGFVSQKETWTRIDASDKRYPKCSAPAPKAK